MKFRCIDIVAQGTYNAKSQVLQPQMEIKSHKAIAYFLSNSENLTLERTKLDMQSSEELIECKSHIKSLTLNRSELKLPNQLNSTAIAPTSINIDLMYSHGDIQNSQQIYSGVESLTLRNCSAPLLQRFIAENSEKMVNLQKLACKRQMLGLIELPLSLKDDRKLEVISLRAHHSMLSEAIQLMYTRQSKLTVISISSLVADIQLLFHGIDTGLLPSHIYTGEITPAHETSSLSRE